jgi:hypothetical protein
MQHMAESYAKRYLEGNAKRQEPNGLTIGSFLAYEMSNAKRKEYGAQTTKWIAEYCAANGAHQGKSSAGAVAWYPVAVEVVA